MAMTEFTCPMHPEIRKPEPGSCSICGMALEPVNISVVHPEENWKMSPKPEQKVPSFGD
jgi:hypothetical protein